MMHHSDVSDGEDDGDVVRSRWSRPPARRIWRPSSSTGNLTVGITATVPSPSTVTTPPSTEAFGFRSVDRRLCTTELPPSLGLSRSISLRHMAPRPLSSSVSSNSTVRLGDGDGENRTNSGSVTTTGALDADDDEDDGELVRRKRLQLYVLVARCIALPFNVDTALSRDTRSEKAKLTEDHLLVLKERFRLFLGSSLADQRLVPAEGSDSSACRSTVIAYDDFVESVQKFHDAVFSSSKRLTGNGALTADDLRSIWQKFADEVAAKTVLADTVGRSTAISTRTLHNDIIVDEENLIDADDDNDDDDVGGGYGGDKDQDKDRQLILRAIIDAWATHFELVFSGKIHDRTKFPSQTANCDTTASKKFPLSTKEDHDLLDGLEVATSSGNDAGVQMNRDLLYELFQNLLGVKNYEHQLLFNALQLSNVDEQILQVRKEITTKREKIDQLMVDPQYNGIPRLHDMRGAVDALEERLDQPVSLPQIDEKKLRPWKIMTPISVTPGRRGLSLDISNMSVLLMFGLKVTVLRVKGLKAIPAEKQLFCTLRVKGCDKMQTEHVRGSDKPIFNTHAEFDVETPLPVVKVKLFIQNHSFFSLDDIELGRVVLSPTLLCDSRATWYPMKTSKNSVSNDVLIKVAAHFKRPSNLKHCGHLLCQGKKIWKKWEKRYYLLVQVSQCRYALCSYTGRKVTFTDKQPLDGFTVEYCEPPLDGSLPGGRFYFVARKHHDWIKFAVDDELECSVWVQTMCRATGQMHQPRPSAAIPVPSCRPSQATRDIHRARQYGILDDYIMADPSELNHDNLFKKLHRLVLKQRMKGTHVSMGHLTRDQKLILEEYCSRYYVHPYRHNLACLRNLLFWAGEGYAVDSRLIREHLEFCTTFTTDGNEHSSFVFIEELYDLSEITKNLVTLISKQLTSFRTVFPLGRPPGAFSETVRLLEYVKYNATVPATAEEVSDSLRSIMEQGAMESYEELADSIAFDSDQEIMPSESSYRQLEKLLELSVMCMAHIEETTRYYDREFDEHGELMIEYCEAFLLQFYEDMEAILDQLEPDIEPSMKFQLFRQLNEQLTDNDRLREGKFHDKLLELYTVQLESYLDLMASTILNRIEGAFGMEDWQPYGKGCATSEYMLWAVNNLQRFVGNIRWSDSSAARKLKNRTVNILTQAIHTAVECTKKALAECMKTNCVDTEYIVPTKVLVMLNVVVDCSRQPYDVSDDVTISASKNHMTQLVTQQFENVLDRTLSRLARYDQSSLLSSIRRLTNTADEIGDDFVQFVVINADRIVQTITDEPYSATILEIWYLSIMKRIYDWLVARNDQSLQSCQVTCLSYILAHCKSEFHQRGVTSETIINCSMFKMISDRLLHRHNYFNATSELVSGS